MKAYKIQANFPLNIPLVFLAVISGAWLILNVLPIPLEGQLEPASPNPLLAGILLVVSVLLLYKANRSGLTLDDNGLVYTPLFGARKGLSYGDLAKISTGGKSYCLYTTDGKRLIQFDDTYTKDASQIVAFLKEKGVRSEF